MATSPKQMARRLRDPTHIDLQPLEQDPRYIKVRQELDAIKARIELSERRRKIAEARNRGAQPTRSVESRAQDLVAGGQVVVLPPAAELEAADEELLILHKARCSKNEELDRVRSEISFEICQQFAPLNADAMRHALDAAAALFQALEAARVIRGRLIGAGYQVNETALPVHHFPAAAALGDPDRGGATPAGMFKAWMRDKGLIDA
ncbi:MAG TPA: hypothetical protein VJ738_01890 [Steroidobacteraceae bacterium]|nr:hypothetical protein [Steroidobacteraceae bacterium]